MADGDRVERLEADRKRLELAMDDCEPRELASLVREHRAVMKEIAELTPADEKVGDPVDDLARRRAARHAAG